MATTEQSGPILSFGGATEVSKNLNGPQGCSRMSHSFVGHIPGKDADDSWTTGQSLYQHKHQQFAPSSSLNLQPLNSIHERNNTKTSTNRGNVFHQPSSPEWMKKQWLRSYHQHHQQTRQTSSNNSHEGGVLPKLEAMNHTTGTHQHPVESSVSSPSGDSGLSSNPSSECGAPSPPPILIKPKPSNFSVAFLLGDKHTSDNNNRNSMTSDSNKSSNKRAATDVAVDNEPVSLRSVPDSGRIHFKHHATIRSSHQHEAIPYQHLPTTSSTTVPAFIHDPNSPFHSFPKTPLVPSTPAIGRSNSEGSSLMVLGGLLQGCPATKTQLVANLPSGGSTSVIPEDQHYLLSPVQQHQQHQTKPQPQQLLPAQSSPNNHRTNEGFYFSNPTRIETSMQNPQQILQTTEPPPLPNSSGMMGFEFKFDKNSLANAAADNLAGSGTGRTEQRSEENHLESGALDHNIMPAPLDLTSSNNQSGSPASNSTAGSPHGLCLVCEDKASGFHYSVVSCEGCKGFFRRSVQKNMEYSCPKDGKCPVNRITRNRCQACRFHKCLSAGMSKESVRQDGNRKRKIRDEEEEEEIKASGRLQKLILHVSNTYKSSILSLVPSIGGFHEDLEEMKKRLPTFSEKIPGFPLLTLHDQAELHRNALLILTLLWRSYRKEYIRETGALWSGIKRIQFSLEQMQIYPEEIGLLSAICLLTSNNLGLEESTSVDDLQASLLEGLRIQIQLRRPKDQNLCSKLLLKLSDLRALTFQQPQTM